ncbi:MAG: lysine--tRNA ligase [Bradymonadales bacterium]
MRGRIDKMKALSEEGIEVFASGFRPRNRASDLHERYKNSTNEELEALGAKGEIAHLAGRIMAVRLFGKGAFAVIKDSTAKIQIHISKSVLGDEAFELFKRLDIGDIIGVYGPLFYTKTNELSVRAQHFELLSKSLRPLPEKWHGLTDTESRLRQRYVDFIMNDEVRNVFALRSRIISELRKQMLALNFLEVETPMMHSLAGGAAARPFKTHHNAHNMELYLRIAPELYLKRLIVGGFERVFELNRNFRNEGISRRHNPEFTMMEFYMAYETHESMMQYVEKIVQNVAESSIGTHKIHWSGYDIDLAGPWRRLRIREAVAQALDLPESALADREVLERAARELPEPPLPAQIAAQSDGHLLMAIFEQRCEASLIQPTFVCEYPASVSPLARRNDAAPEFVDRFEVFIGGIEIGNAFSELNDPLDQRQRFLDQIEAKAAGDEEAHPMDADYIRALEYGMPPCAGCGLGIDRLVMLLTACESIRDVILFPLLKPEH